MDLEADWLKRGQKFGDLRFFLYFCRVAYSNGCVFVNYDDLGKMDIDEVGDTRPTLGCLFCNCLAIRVI